MEAMFKRTVSMMGVIEGVLDPDSVSRSQADKDAETGVPLRDNTCLYYDQLIGLDIKMCTVKQKQHKRNHNE